jgi:rRNA maturation RNase YbeY
MNELVLRNRQRDRAVSLPRLREFTLALLEDELGLAEYELGILLVGSKIMAQVNQDFLGHEGSTDVITFDHRDNAQGPLFGELYICAAVAVEQAARFKTSWQEELARYVIHGVLHLLGYDDLSPEPRRVMKRKEGQLLRRLARKLPVAYLAAPETVRKRAARRR